MTRREHQEAVSAAIAAAYGGGCSTSDIQDAIAFGSHDAGKLGAESLANRGLLHPEGK